MANALLGGVLPAVLSGGNTVRARLKTLLSNPQEFFGQRVQDLQTAQDQDSASTYLMLKQKDPARAAEVFPQLAQSDPDWVQQQSDAGFNRNLDIAGMGTTSGGRGVQNALSRYAQRRAGTTVRDPIRVAFPGIYDNPRDIVQSQVVAPESPLLKQLWGVTREDLYNMAMTRKGNLPDWRPPGVAPNPRGSAHAERVITPANTQRIHDILGEGMRRPDLAHGMVGWYVQDPMYQRLAAMFGPEEGLRRFQMLNAMEGMASPGSEVLVELNRGSMAHKLAREGRFEDFARYGGLPDELRAGIPEFANVMGHPYHSTAHVLPMRNYLATGRLPGSDKVPAYVTAGQVPELGFQTHRPVGDAHWSRGVGLADVRGSKKFDASVSSPEMVTLAPWYRGIAAEHDLEAVPAQALQWGAMANRTGVDTPIGAPKLELRALQIAKAAEREGVSPETMRDLYLAGERQIGRIDPRLLLGAGVAGAGYLGYKGLTGKVNSLKTENENRRQEALRRAGAE